MNDLNTIIPYFWNWQIQFFNFLVTFQYTQLILLALLFGAVICVLFKIIKIN